MAYQIRVFLSEKAQSNELPEEFYKCVGITPQRIEAIIFGRCSATVKEINNVAKYFNISSSKLMKWDNTPTNITKQCEHCSEDYIPVNARAIYCSNACRNKAFRANK